MEDVLLLTRCFQLLVPRWCCERHFQSSTNITAGLPFKRVRRFRRPDDRQHVLWGGLEDPTELNLRRFRLGFDKPHIEPQVYLSGIRKGARGYLFPRLRLIGLTIGPSGQNPNSASIVSI